MTIQGVQSILHVFGSATMRVIERREIDRVSCHSGPPAVAVFLIPLVPRIQTNSWDLVETHLGQTLDSLIRQDSGDWLALVVGHDRPRVIDERHDSRVLFLRAPFSPSGDTKDASSDKHRKRRLGATWVAKKLAGPTWLIALDADDLVHKSFVSRLAIAPNGNQSEVVIFDAGYSYDAFNQDIRLWESNFNRVCGSSFGAFLTKTELPRHSGDRHSTFSQVFSGKHAQVARRALEIGVVCRVSEFRGIAYLVNHSESLAQKWNGSKRRTVGQERPKLTGAARRDFLENFAPPR